MGGNNCGGAIIGGSQNVGLGGSALEQITTGDNNIAIGLDFFLGKDSKYYKKLRNHEYIKFQKPIVYLP